MYVCACVRAFMYVRVCVCVWNQRSEVDEYAEFAKGGGCVEREKGKAQKRDRLSIFPMICFKCLFLDDRDIQ